MPISTDQPTRPTRIEAQPEVAAFYDRAQLWTEIAALAVMVLTVVYFAGQFLRLAIPGQH